MTYKEPVIVVELGLDLNLIEVTCPFVCDEIETIPRVAIVLDLDDPGPALDAPTDTPMRTPGIMITWPLEQTRCEDCVQMMGEPEDDDEEDW
jgi:hypothetical protein